ncbi:MAG: PVC-type heme-binding CxxCH protein [Pirellulales bacterium]
MCLTHIPIRVFAALLLIGSATIGARAAEPPLELNKKDHIAVIGNTLADRMQHAAWLETYIAAQFPEHDLVFRNLGYSGDELKVRQREENFGSPDEWLSKVEADVVFCFFGYNEALKGLDALPAFRKDLADVIDGMSAQKYNGRTAPRVVFFSPIAHEDLKSPNLPDGRSNNVKLEAYTQAMREVCEAKHVRFVDLFHPTRELYAAARQPLTMNGIHLLDNGDQAVARVIMNDLFGGLKSKSSEAELERLRQTILDKNYHWFSRYRVVDGYNVFGGRSKLSWFGQSNADVMMREMEIFDVKTANRDQRVWAVARGGDLAVSDSNLPEELKVKTNIPGPLPDTKHQYLGGKEAIDKMKIAQGMNVNLFASEEMFPELVNPVQMAVDTDGKLFVSVWPSYPHWNPVEPRRDRILCLPDDNGDGVADRCITFADELNSVTGFEFWGGGMLVAALPEIWFLKDTDGDYKADVKIRMLQGVCSADSHHSANAMLIGPDGWLYWSRGIFNVATMETPTKTVRSGESGVHRFNPRTFEMEFHFPIGPNPHGDVFDQWGYQFANDGTGGSGSYVNIGKGIGNRPWFKMRVRPVAATGILSSSHFPEKNQGNFLICNCIGFLGVLQHEVKYNGAEVTAEEIEPILVSSDPNFRPSDVEVGGDGALYVSDWSNAIIGHMQHNMRDPNRDHEHGRIYRVTAEGRPLVKPLRLKGKPIEEVCSAFYAGENSARYRARLELSGRDSKQVAKDVGAWAAKLNPAVAADAQAALECLWVFEEHRIPNEALLVKAFHASEPRVRAAAIRTLGHWGEKVPGWEPLLIAAARDESALVRAEAVKSAVEFTGPATAVVFFEAAARPLDAELQIVLNYAKSRIQPDATLQQALRSGASLSPAALQYAYQYATPADLLKLPRTAELYSAILKRTDASLEDLRTALQGLAQLQKSSPLPTLMDLIEARDAADQSSALSALAQLTLEMPAADLKKVLPRIEKLSAAGKTSIARRTAYAAWITAEQSSDSAMLTASKSLVGLRDLLAAVTSLRDGTLRGKMYPVARSLMFELPPGLPAQERSAALQKSGIQVEYYHPSPSNVAIETLDKLRPQATGVVPRIIMEVPQRKEADAFALRFTGSVHVATAGTHTFFIASDDGSRIYLDGKLFVDNDGLHGMVEKGASVDLAPGPHALVVTYFDNGGGDGLQVHWSGPGFAKQPIATERLSVSSGDESIYDVAIRTVASLPGHEAEKFSDWAGLVRADRQVKTALDALAQLPESAWNTKEVPGLIDNTIGYLSNLPVVLRTSESSQGTIRFAKALAAKLSADKAAEASKRLDNLDVRVIAIGTVVERMIYDKETIVVQAGKSVEFRFANTDNMPHNLAFVKPGSLEEVGLAAEATARDADAKDRHYVPKSDKVLLASRLIAPGESQSIVFDVPAAPGYYPYVCTYPGHWRRMFGALIVVENLDEYQASPEQYVQAHPLPIRDELLKTIGRNTQWKFEDFAAEVKQLPAGRSFEVGKSLFKSANCVGCHKLNGDGREFGPDLAKLDADKRKSDYLLRSMLEPSRDIHEKYQSVQILLDSGKVITGMVVEENDAVVKLLADPTAKGEPLSIPKDEIEQRTVSKVSIMPQGLLDRLTKEEVLDLLVYVAAGGNSKHALYGDHQHHH